MRTVTISTDVYAKIWAERREGEESEDDILRRILKCTPRKGVALESSSQGFYDPTFNASFPEGFEMFRVYKGTEYRTRATKGCWFLLNDKTTHHSLHQLTKSITHGHANAWHFWRFEQGGKTKEITELRDKSRIVKRK